MDQVRLGPGSHLGPGSQSKCKGRVCWQGPLAAQTETCHMSYTHGDMATVMFWNLDPNPQDTRAIIGIHLGPVVGLWPKVKGS